MLQFIRDKSQGVVAIVIFGLLALSFALWGIHNYFDTSGQNATMVKVNGVKISKSQFQSTYQHSQAQALHMGFQLNNQQAIKAFRTQVLNNMIMMTLLHESAASNNFAVSPTLLELTIAKLPMFQQNGVFSKDRFVRLLQAMGYTQQQFLNSLGNSLLIQQVHNGITENAFSLPYMTQRALSLVYQTRSFDYVLVPASSFKNNIKVSHQQAMAYYKANQQKFTVPQQVSVNYITLSLPAIEKNIKTTDAKLQAFYKSSINLFSVPQQWKVSRIVVPLSPEASDKQIAKVDAKVKVIEANIAKDKTAFDKYAKQYPATDKIGQGGWVSLLEVPQNIQLVLMKLKKAGDMSKPIKTTYGMEIIKATAFKAAQVHPYAQVQKRVHDVYVQQHAQKMFSTQTDRLQNLTFEHPNSLKSAAGALNLKVQQSPLFEKTNGKDMFANAKVINAAFSDDVLTNGNNSDIITLNNTQVMVLRADKKVPAKLKPFSTVADEIHDDLAHQQMVKMATQVATEIAKNNTSVQGLQADAKKHSFKFSTVDNVNHNKSSKTLAPLLVESAFALPVPYKNILPKKVVQMANGDSAVVMLTKVTHADSSTIKADTKTAFSKALTVTQGNLDYALYMHGLRNDAKIKYYNTTNG